MEERCINFQLQCMICQILGAPCNNSNTMRFFKVKDMWDLHALFGCFGICFVGLCGFIMYRLYFCRACENLVIMTYEHIWLARSMTLWSLTTPYFWNPLNLLMTQKNILVIICLWHVHANHCCCQYATMLLCTRLDCDFKP